MAVHRDGCIAPQKEHTQRRYGVIGRILDQAFESAYNRVGDDVRLKWIVAGGVDFQNNCRSGFGNKIARGI